MWRWAFVCNDSHVLIIYNIHETCVRRQFSDSNLIPAKTNRTNMNSRFGDDAAVVVICFIKPLSTSPHVKCWLIHRSRFKTDSCQVFVFCICLHVCRSIATSKNSENTIANIKNLTIHCNDYTCVTLNLSFILLCACVHVCEWVSVHTHMTFSRCVT